jgi:hypothetical protein
MNHIQLSKKGVVEVSIEHKEHLCPSTVPPKGCPDIFPGPPKPPKPPVKRKRAVSDEICGNIHQDCNGEFVEYWKALGIHDLPSGSVSVVNKSGCTMTVAADLIGDGIEYSILFTVDEGQTKSITLCSIASLEVSCEGEGNGKCSGTYCITLNYERDC